MVLDLAAHKDKGVYRLKAVDDIFQTLEENQVVLSAMKSTRYSCPNTKIIINLYLKKTQYSVLQNIYNLPITINTKILLKE